MHRIAGWLVVLMGTFAFSACGEPTGPTTVFGPRPALGVERGRRPGTGPISVPDSIGIPPSPIPPIYEEAPPNFDGAQ
jgi:hypothetical protein